MTEIPTIRRCRVIGTMDRTMILSGDSAAGHPILRLRIHPVRHEISLVVAVAHAVAAPGVPAVDSAEDREAEIRIAVEARTAAVAEVRAEAAREEDSKF